MESFSHLHDKDCCSPFLTAEKKVGCTEEELDKGSCKAMLDTLRGLISDDMQYAKKWLFVADRMEEFKRRLFGAINISDLWKI